MVIAQICKQCHINSIDGTQSFLGHARFLSDLPLLISRLFNCQDLAKLLLGEVYSLDKIVVLRTIIITSALFGFMGGLFYTLAPYFYQ